MPVIGVGIDVVDIDRFVQSLERTPSLRARLFTDALDGYLVGIWNTDLPGDCMKLGMIAGFAA